MEARLSPATVQAEAQNGACGDPRRADGPAALEAIVALRALVWRSERDVIDAAKLSPDASLFRDAGDARALHWTIEADGSVVAAARLCLQTDAGDLPGGERFGRLLAGLPTPVALLSRLVVHPAMRRRGLAQALTEVRMEAARSWGARSIVVEASPRRIAPLLALGFVELGLSAAEPFDLAAFTLMALRL